MSELTHKRRVTGGLALLVSLAMTAMALLYVGGSPATSATGSGAAKAASFTKVAHSPQGYARSKIVGQTAKGQPVTGSFVPLSFSKKNGHLRAHGLLNGVIHRANGTTKTFTVVRTLRVKSMNGTVPGARTAGAAATAKATCDILHLVLAPLDLNLLGLKVHLDRVVLDIVAQSGAGQLLGNLLCAVAGLLDGNGTLGQILNQLTAILNQLLMGL
jgi:hypothetical protein